VCISDDISIGQNDRHFAWKPRQGGNKAPLETIQLRIEAIHPLFGGCNEREKKQRGGNR